MRQLLKTDIDANTVKIEIKENDKLIVEDVYPSKWAFENNSTNQLNGLLSAAGQPELTDAEKSQLNTWINEG
jgi:hypothetical protein